MSDWRGWVKWVALVLACNVAVDGEQPRAMIMYLLLIPVLILSEWQAREPK